MKQFTTPRLRLNVLQQEDILEAVEALNTNEARKYLGGIKEDIAASEAYHEMLDKSGIWSVRLIDSDVFIGIVSLTDYHEAHYTELSYVFSDKHWGKGYAYEAVVPIIEYAKEQLRLDVIVAETQSANYPSIRLLEKLNFHKKHELMRFDNMQSVYELHLNDYIAYLRARVGNAAVNLTGVNVLITNHKHQILLQKRGEYPLKWGLIGGIVELGETLEAACLREAYEETGLTLTDQPTLIGTTSGKDCYMHLPNGHQAYFITAGFHINYNGEPLSVDGKETKELVFFDFDNLPEELVKSHRNMIDVYLSKCIELH